MGIFKREGGRRRMLMRRMRGSSPGWLTTERTPWRLEAQKKEEDIFLKIHSVSQCGERVRCKVFARYICDIRIVSSVKD